MKSIEKNKYNNGGKKLVGRKKIITTFFLASTLSACDNMSNNNIVLNYENQSAKFKVEYQYYEWSTSTRIVDYEIMVSKQWDTYTWLINEIDWRKSNKTSIESDNLDEVFNEIRIRLDDVQLTDKTINNKNKKIEFVEKEYKKLLNSGENEQVWDIIISYKKK